ncbi:uncharacterized protein PRCAT00000496001 [Priceomyces carsonii]|uniref:uncharacterized protein n=1 Tax=Priceomyces carsonii TaxID=28549 RepID=UPI002EDA4ED9|nr:unnamed protein product [Priceomyces carsonii]
MNGSSFDEEEDNNPFSQSHQGIASIMNDRSQLNDKKDEDITNEDDDESMLLYTSGSKDPTVTNDAFNKVQMNYESRVTMMLKPNKKAKIQITEAGNSSEGMLNSLKKYIVYTIKLIDADNKEDEVQTRRRYSDFESLREILTKIFPLIIIPPIPPKNYFNFTMLNFVSQDHNGNTTNTTNNSLPNNYAYINSTHLNKNKLIEHRKRLLTSFLNNCLQIPQVRNLEFFAKFLDPNANWTDEISLISSQLPKSIYLLNPENGLRTDSLYENLPNPVSNHTMSFLKDNRKRLSKKTNKILSTETTTPTDNVVSHTGSSHRHNAFDTSGLDCINKKIMENFSGLSNDYMELGAIFNSFSLILSESPRVGRSKSTSDEDEEATLHIIFDKIGQVFDRSYITINSLIGDLETKFSEPLGEAVQYSDILAFVTKFQERKVRQKSLLDSELVEKRNELEDLMKAEKETSRIENVGDAQAIAKDAKFDLSTATDTSVAANQLTAHQASKFRMFPTMSSFKKITQYVTEIIDQNPEETRKQRISSLIDKIGTLEKCQTIMLQDINYVTDELNKNIKLFHAKQFKLIYEILSCYTGFLISWAKKNLDIWEEIKLEIEKL